MNILVINGSPRMERSNSLRMTRAFLEGLAKTCDTQVEELTVAKMHIEPCLGCLNCWKRTPGKCFRDDDMAAAIESYVTADLVVWSFPLYYYALPGQLKCFLDRTVPINRPVMCDRTDGKGNGKHVTRYDQSHQRHVLISTCGFFSPKGNYDAVLAQFDLMLGVGNYTTLFCGEGEMMPVPPLQERVEEYLGYLDEDGYLYLRGRKDSLIISGGENIYPEEVIDVLLKMPEIAEAAVYGMPDPKWGEHVKASIVCKPGRSLTVEQVQTFCRANMPSFRMPREVEFLPELPKNATGKVLIQALKNR